MTIEIYKDVVGYEGIYQVSNLGNVKKIYKKYPNGIILKPIYNHGYFRIGLWQNNNKKIYYIHRLVAQSFIKNPNNYPFINHINGIKNDNNVNNLEWCTQAQNNKHAIEMGLINHCKKIIDIKTGITYESVRDLSLKINVPRSTIQYWLTYQKNNQSNFRYL
jgi:hypothetical protein